METIGKVTHQFVSKILKSNLLELVQYFSYVEITDRNHQNLWKEYEGVQEQFPDYFAMEQIKEVNDIYPRFSRRLFEKKKSLKWLKKNKYLSTGSDWNFELIQRYGRRNFKNCSRI